MTEDHARRFAITVFLVMACFGLGMFATGVVRLLKWEKVGSWTEVPARLISLEVLPDTSARGTGDTGHPAVRLKCQYDYKISDRVFHGSRITISDDGIEYNRFLQIEEKLTVAYRDGLPWKVYVNPKNPQQTVLVNVEGPRGWSWPLGGLGFAVSGLLFAFLTKSGYLQYEQPSVGRIIRRRR